MTQPDASHSLLSRISGGISAIALGGISGLLFVLPILGLTIGIAGFVTGAVTLCLAFRNRSECLTYSMIGCVVSAISVGGCLAIMVVADSPLAPRTLLPDTLSPSARIEVAPPTDPLGGPNRP